MILVLSFYEYEQGTEGVIDWLLYYKAKFLKLSIEQLTRQSKRIMFDVNNNEYYFRNINLSKNINVVFYRRFRKIQPLNFINISSTIHSQIKSECNTETEYLYTHLFHCLKNKKWLPNYFNTNVNKLNLINIANSFDINVPTSKIINNKMDLIYFFNEYNQGIVTKPIHHSSYYIIGENAYSAYTSEVNLSIINTLPEYFPPSLFQEKIDSEYEIRSFVIDGKFYSTAIMVNNANRNIDIKLNYNSNKISWVVYKLPIEYENKIIKLMNQIGLNTGSIDTIKAKNGTYYFIEINPVGQYNAPGYRCNYNIEKVMSEWLIKNDIP